MRNKMRSCEMMPVYIQNFSTKLPQLVIFLNPGQCVYNTHIIIYQNKSRAKEHNHFYGARWKNNVMGKIVSEVKLPTNPLRHEIIMMTIADKGIVIDLSFCFTWYIGKFPLSCVGVAKIFNHGIKVPHNVSVHYTLQCI